MEEDEDIKKSVEKQENYDEFSIKKLLDEINSLKKKLKFLENLLKTRNQAATKLINYLKNKRFFYVLQMVVCLNLLL